ncbi:phytoene desaturase family protein [Candidatus Clostridium radicumherbarum]|uniref:Phytoene desaturase family protein n=1 Tax=Candidatus Clostridium radicumherbarum TaxID=3381662 RepID=A0ABW8TZF9_9CLOT
MESKVVIIGAGLTGLSAGIHLQEKGIKTEIFEISGQAGGMCTSWERKGFRFDGCIHWMVGTRSDSPIYKLYREVDALAEDTVIYNTESIKTEIQGIIYEIPLRLEPFKNFLISLSPEDHTMIDELCSNIKIMRDTRMPIGAPSSITEFINLLRYSRGFLSVARKFVGVTVKDYVEKFKNVLLKSVLYDLMPPQFSLMALFMMLGTRMGDNAGYPMGGAHDVINRMVNKYISLGGKINYQSKVEEIIVENDRVTAVKSKGNLYPATAVVAACDMYDTLKNMLGGKYKHPELDKMLESAELFDPVIVVSFGMKQRFNLPYSQTFICTEGIKTAPDLVSYHINLRSFEFDPTSAPENCSSVMVMLESKLDYWQNLRKTDINRYRTEKQQIADRVVDFINQRIPGFKDAIAVTDVATPATYIRYANLYKASWEGFAPTPEALKTNIRKTIDGVKGLYLCGQWTTAGGGICTAVASGKDAAKSVLKYI